MRKPTTPLIVLAAVAALSYGLGLYAGERADEVERLIAEINAHDRAIHVLEAELAYRARPERLQALADNHMALQPPAPEQILPDIVLLPDGSPQAEVVAAPQLDQEAGRAL